MASRKDITFKSYRRFLTDLLEGLQVAIAEAENAEWHHLNSGPAKDQYNRLLTWELEVSGRLVRVNGITTPRV